MQIDFGEVGAYMRRKVFRHLQQYPEQRGIVCWRQARRQFLQQADEQLLHRFQQPLRISVISW